MQAPCRLAVIVAGLLGVASLAAEAQTANEQIDLTISASSFGHVAAEGAWTQRVVRLHNKGRRGRLAKVIYVAPQTTGGQINYSRTVPLPARSIRSIRLPVRFGAMEISDRPATRGQRPSPVLNRETYILWDARVGRRITQDFASVFGLRPGGMSLAVIGQPSSPNDGYSYLGSLPKRQLGDVKLASAAAAESLPDRWYGYDMFRIVLARRLDMSALRGSQLEALLEWVRRGGVLVLAGGESMADMLGGPLGQAAGVWAAGQHYVGSLQPDKPAAHPPVRLPRPMPMLWLVPDGAEVVLEANGHPLLTKHAMGHGAIFCLATPAGALADEALHHVWSWVRSQVESVAPIEDNLFMAPQKKEGRRKEADILLPAPCRTALESIAGRRGPPRTAPTAALLALAALTVALGVVLRPRPRGEWIWVILIPLTLLVGVGVYAYGKSQTGQQRLSFVGLISGTGGHNARVQTANAYYSGTGGVDLAPSIGDGVGVILPAGGADVGSATEEVRFDGAMSLGERKLRPNSMYPFYLDTSRRIGAIEGNVSFDQAGAAGRLLNRLGMDIFDAVALAGRRVYRVGDIPADGSAAVQLTPDDRLGQDEFTGSLVRGPADALRNQLVGKLLARPAPRKTIARQPVLIGYTSRNPLQPVADGELQQQGWCVVVWPLELGPSQPGQNVFIPAGFVQLALATGGGGVPAWDPDHEEFVRVFGSSQLLVTVRPPEPTGPLGQMKVHLTVNIRAPDHRLTVFGVPQRHGTDDRPVEIDTFDRPSGTIKLTIPDADRFCGADGACVLSLKVAPQAATEKAPSAGRPAGWKFLNIDVALEGIVQ